MVQTRVFQNFTHYIQLKVTLAVINLTNQRFDISVKFQEFVMLSSISLRILRCSSISAVPFIPLQQLLQLLITPYLAQYHLYLYL